MLPAASEAPIYASMSFSPNERERYARHILLKEIGGPGQQRLKAVTVAIVGVGGLGAPAALYLAAAGAGRLRLIDDDAVSLSNLQRQIIYRSADIGAAKAARAAETLQALNPHVEIETRVTRLLGPPASSPAGSPSSGEDAGGPGNAHELLAGADVVLDGSDDFATRFAVNAACHALGVTLISGAVGRWSGQLAVFAPEGPCYRCFVPEAPPDAETCARVGVVGALTGVIGSMMALEAIKHITQAGETLTGRVLVYDALAGTARTIALTRDPACPVCGHG